MDMGGILDLETKLPENFHKVGGLKKILCRTVADATSTPNPLLNKTKLNNNNLYNTQHQPPPPGNRNTKWDGEERKWGIK
jgi:hypothetical protein